jgi:hypothetical protein
MPVAKCRGPGCESTRLIEAHIIPRCFAVYIGGNNPAGGNVQLTQHGSANAWPPLGEYDTGILCAACDQRLGKLDGYFYDVCRRFERDAIRVGRHYEMASVDCDRVARFFWSLIWRASITDRATFAEVDLAEHGEAVRDLVFGDISLAAEKRFQVAIERFESEHVDVSRIYSPPRPGELGGFVGFGFMFVGFRVFAKVNEQPFPGPASSVLNGRSMLCVPIRRFEGTPEFEATAEMMITAIEQRRAAGAT